ncbi:hypothetical protein EG328_006156 [Venturia inaequalis]|uniref:Uncharacterized protein n=1 Tax=Venturia inaequalis TaxID=5025 RepID=A0A8H3UYB4_VENIN|nr:hypothetical protein EG328_006156 [Venturia inaequalis]KAE9977863.1 hypothetical protein EG327_007571 [Venturia inaequalis]RDI79286.1 Transmembrane protein 184 [Venturia inaequalis]
MADMDSISRKIKIPFLPNELGDIIMDDSCLTIDDHLKLCCIKPFHDSANRKIYERVTIAAPTEGPINVRYLCKFLRTVIENPTLANYVRSLEVRFPNTPLEKHQPGEEPHRDNTTLFSMRRHVGKDIALIKTAMRRVGFLFNFESEPNEYVISNALVAIVLSQTPNLRSLMLDYEDDDWRNLYSSSLAPPPWERLFKNLNRLEHFEMRNLRGPHGVHYTNILQTILMRPSLRTFKTQASLPCLDLSHGENHITKMDLEVTALEISKRDPNLIRLLQKSQALEELQISIPKNCVLPTRTRQDLASPLLSPIASTLRKLTLGYVCYLSSVRINKAWPGILDMTSCVALTDVKMSWHYFKTPANTDVVKYFPPSLTKLRIYDIPFEAHQGRNFQRTTEHPPISVFTHFYFPHIIESSANTQNVFLGHIRDLGGAHRSQRLPKLEELVLEMSVLDQLVEIQADQEAKDLLQLGLLDLLKYKFYPKCAAYVHELGDARFIMLNNKLDVNACTKARLEDAMRRASKKTSTGRRALRS